MQTTVQENLIAIPLGQIVPTKNNCRIIDEKSPAFLELVESVQSSGVRIPVHVRKHPQKKDHYELLAGERRYRASRKAGKETINAINHGDIDDTEAFEITFTENYQRQDLTPLEEGKAVAVLMERHNGDVKAVASMLGHSSQWVKQREAIQNKLSKVWRDSMAKPNSDYNQWSAAHLGLIARLPKETQDNLYKEFTSSHRSFGDMSVDELDKRITSYLGVISKCPWNPDDETLVPKVGACSKCTKRSGHNPGLFHDDLPADELQKQDQCLDPICRQKKLEAYLKRKEAELRKQYPNLKLIATDWMGYSIQEAIDKKWGKGVVIEQGYYSTSKKTAKGAIPALVVYGKGEGQLKWITLNTSSRQGSQSTKQKDKPTPLKERRAALDAKRWSQTLIVLREQLEKCPLDKIKNSMPVLTVVVLASQIGTHTVSYSSGVWKKLEKALKDAESNHDTTLHPYLCELWEEVKKVLVNELVYHGPITQTPKHLIDTAKSISALVGIDIDAIFKDVSQQKGFTEPMSWVMLNADGTMKKVPKNWRKKLSEKKKVTKKKTKASRKKSKKQ